MAVRVIISDSEDEENVPIRTIRPCRTNRVIYSDEESITDESDVSYVGPEEELNKTHSPLQVNHKRAPGQRIIISDAEEEGQTDTTTSNTSHISSTSSHDSSASEFYSVYSKVQGDLDDSNNPVHTKHLTTPKQQVIDSGDEDETDTARTYVPSSLPAEETLRETTSQKAAIGKEILEKDKEVVGIETLEKGKENKSPDPQLPTAPDKLPQLGPVSHPVVQPLKAPPTVAAMAPSRPINDTFSVAHTRPALLKQLEYVKVRLSFAYFVVLQSILEASCYYWCKPS